MDKQMEWPSLLSALGLRSQVVKTALAAGFSWWLATKMGTERPYFAPLAAILCLQVTVAESLSRGYQRILGIVGGIFLAMLAEHFAGADAISIAVVVLIGTAVSTRLGLGEQAVTQVAISALMVMTVGSHIREYSWERVVDTVIGAAVAVAVNMFIFPPDYTGVAATSFRDLTTRIVALTEEIRTNVLHDWPQAETRQTLERARSLARPLSGTEADIKQAEQALQYSPLMARRRNELSRYGKGLELFGKAVTHLRGIARTFAEMGSRRNLPEESHPFGKEGKERLSRIFQLLKESLSALAEYVRTENRASLSLLQSRLTAIEKERLRIWDRNLLGETNLQRQSIASVLNDIEQLVIDMDAMAAEQGWNNFSNR